MTIDRQTQTDEGDSECCTPLTFDQKPMISVKATDALFNVSNAHIKEDIIRMILQYLHDEGYHSSRLILHDEANVKYYEQDSLQQEIKKIKKLILDGEWTEIEQRFFNNTSKSFLKNKTFLYSCYKQQFLEYIEHHEHQKAFTLLTRKLKPLEMHESKPNEFRDLCYLLTSKSISEITTFSDWEGVASGREKLAQQLQNIMELENMSENGFSLAVPSSRLVNLLQQAVAYQIASNRYQPSLAPKVSTLLQDYQPYIVPNACERTFSGHSGNVKCVEWVGEDGLYILSGSSDNTARAWNIDTGECLFVLEGHSSRIWSASATKSGLSVATASGDGTVKIWDLKHHKPSCSATFSESTSDIYSVSFHYDSRHLVSAGYDKIVRFYDVQKQSVVKSLSGHSLSVSSCIFNPYGNLIITGSKDNTVKFWDISSGLCVKTISSHLGEVTSVEMNSQGTMLLSSSKDNSIRLWDIRMVRPVKRFKGHQNTSKNFIRAGFAGPSLIVSGSEDGFVHVWNIDKGESLQKLKGHEGAVYQAAWNSKVSKWVSCSDDFTVKLWWFDNKSRLD